jgi:ribosomal protein S27E
MQDDDFAYVDGNAAAGPLQEILAVEPTTVRGRCTACGRTSMLADTRVYFGGPGLVMRCRGCGSELMTVVSTPTSTRLDISGLTHLTFPLE